MVNFTNFLYFTWDQGRDAWMLRHILQGDFTLIGPTSGLQGFFLGPLWYYLGVPGYVLTRGNPYGISLWYIALSCLALPIFWLIAHTLYSKKEDKPWALIMSYLLAFLPGSVQGSTFIWNPLVSLPLVAGAFYALLQARHSRVWLTLAFFLWALTLQSEFAYAIFFIGPLWLSIPWIRQKIDWRDFLSTAAAASITFVPQAFFELRHQFIMSKALVNHLQNPADTISWMELAQRRPMQIFWGLKELLFPLGDARWFFTAMALGLIGLTMWQLVARVRKGGHKESADLYPWILTSYLASLPLFFYLLWRGNYGNFFSYYLTPHFIFLIPLIVFALRWIFQQRWQIVKGEHVSVALLGFFIFAALQFNVFHLTYQKNESGLRRMIESIDDLYTWKQADASLANTVAFRVFTPNRQTEHYDYLISWYAQKNHLDIPSTVKTADTQVWYILVEPDREIPEKRFVPWYKEATAGGVLTRQKKVGELQLETWMKPDIASASGLLKKETPPPTGEK